MFLGKVTPPLVAPWSLVGRFSQTEAVITKLKDSTQPLLTVDYFVLWPARLRIDGPGKEEQRNWSVM